MTDKFGVPLNLNDQVVYTTGERGNTFLDIGTIDSFEGAGAKIRSSSGHLLTNLRGSHGIVSVNPAKAQHPELFL